MRAALKAIQAAAGSSGGPVYTDVGSSFADVKRFSLYTDGGSGNFTDTTFSMSGVSEYNGTIDIFVVGTISNAGYYWDAASTDTQTGFGENVFWKYTALGDETSFRISQKNMNSTTLTSGASGLSGAHAVIEVVGGANNGKKAYFGSGAGNNSSYGHGGAANNVSGESDSVFSRQAYGASRNYATAYYSDSTSYGPSPNAEYGDATSTSYTYSTNVYSTPETTQINVRYKSYWASSYQIQLNIGATATYYYSNGSRASSASGGRPNNANNYGGVIFVFRNDH
jgi:hypothetical protein